MHIRWAEVLRRWMYVFGLKRRTRPSCTPVCLQPIKNRLTVMKDGRRWIKREGSVRLDPVPAPASAIFVLGEKYVVGEGCAKRKRGIPR